MNRAVKIRIYPNKEQRVQIEQTIGCSRFIYNQMLADKISYYQKEKKMLRNTPAGYKKEYPWLKEVDSLALANAQLHLESAFRKFFREPACGFPRYKSKKHARNSYTTNALNGNILLQDTHLKLPKMSVIRIKLHRQIPSDWKLKSVIVSREPSGKYFASLLFCCEDQTVEFAFSPNPIITPSAKLPLISKAAGPPPTMNALPTTGRSERASMRSKTPPQPHSRRTTPCSLSLSFPTALTTLQGLPLILRKISGLSKNFEGFTSEEDIKFDHHLFNAQRVARFMLPMNID